MFSMKLRGFAILAVAAALTGADAPNGVEVLKHRTLGKAFYENPTTQNQAVEEFQKALKLQPASIEDKLNLGLSMVRAGQVKEGMALLEEVQKAAPKIPHTWFNLGIENKKLGETDKAIAQLEQMARLVSDEPITHYNLGVLYKASNRAEEANAKFRLAASLDPNFAAPHFQLFNFWRQQGQMDKAREELAKFQDLKRRHEEAGTGNEDVEWSLYSEIYETIEAKASADTSGAAVLQFLPTTVALKADAATARMLVLDLEGNGGQDVVLTSSAGIKVLKNGLTPVAQPGLEALKGVLGAAAGDFDNDGLPDLCVLMEDGAQLFKNTKGVFQALKAELPKGRFEAALWIDYDHDYDLDLVLIGEKSTLVRNRLPEPFEEKAGELPFAAGKALAAVAFRLMPDTKGHDFVLSYADHTAVLYKDRMGGRYEAVATTIPAGAKGFIAADLNNDSAFDLLYNGGLVWNKSGKLAVAPWNTTVANATGDFENRGLLDVVSGGQVFRSLGNGRWDGGRGANGLNATAAAVLAADFDNDGRTDALVVLKDGTVQRCLNKSQLTNSFTRIRLSGVKNLKLAPNTEVEVKAGAFYQKQYYQGVPLTFGLRGLKEIDTVRITWPNGLIQNEMTQKTGTVLAYQEAQRLSGSCPIIWTWNGREFEYVTDVLGVAPLGASSGDGSYFPVDHDEYISIAGRQLKERDRQLEVRITEELSEVTYLDQVQLVAVDHPAKTEIYTNDKWKSPPFPEFRLFGGERRVHAVKATENGRVAVTEKLAKTDQRYPDHFTRDFLNVAAPHTLELDFGTAATENRAVLLLTGWVDWADASTFRAQAQATPEGLVTPKLQVRDAKGEWVTVIEDMGMPSGKPKTVAVDLTGKFLSASREVRIVTNICIYWDEASLIEDSKAPETRLTTLAAKTGDLHFRGFSPVRVHPQRLQPEIFSYANATATSAWNPTPGLYTRFGDVTELAAGVDDKLIVMGSGDELTLKFDAKALPALPEGWTRDWLLKVDGWAKDRDANTAYGQSVEPLPFHGMTSYPYPEGERFPDSQEYRDYRRIYNTRPALMLMRQLTDSGTHTRRSSKE